jgi:hypothetical protein
VRKRKSIGPFEALHQYGNDRVEEKEDKEQKQEGC